MINMEHIQCEGCGESSLLLRRVIDKTAFPVVG
jgi:hypothetical protein